VERGALLRPC